MLSKILVIALFPLIVLIDVLFSPVKVGFKQSAKDIIRYVKES